MVFGLYWLRFKFGFCEKLIFGIEEFVVEEIVEVECWICVLVLFFVGGCGGMFEFLFIWCIVLFFGIIGDWGVVGELDEGLCVWLISVYWGICGWVNLILVLEGWVKLFCWWFILMGEIGVLCKWVFVVVGMECMFNGFLGIFWILGVLMFERFCMEGCLEFGELDIGGGEVFSVVMV